MLLGYKSVAVLTFDDHLNMRKLMTPAFNPKHLARGIPRLVQLAEEHCREWAQKGDVMGAKAIKAFTFHVSCKHLSKVTCYVSSLEHTLKSESWYGVCSVQHLTQLTQLPGSCNTALFISHVIVVICFTGISSSYKSHATLRWLSVDPSLH